MRRATDFVASPPGSRFHRGVSAAGLCLCASVLLFLIVTVVAQAAPSLTAKLDRNVVPVGESVTLSLTFDGVTPAGPPVLPPMSNLRATPNISQSQSVSIINSQQSFFFTYNYVLMATHPGDTTIPAISANAGGRALTSQPLQLRIVPAGGAAPGPNAMATNFAFLRLVVPKTAVYLGEPFQVEVHLYYRQAEDPRRFPQLKADGFIVGQWPQPTQTQTQVGGVAFNLVVFKATATAARAGALMLGPAETVVNELIPTGRRSFFDSGYERRPRTIVSAPIEMTVLALPKENVPQDFNGAIGNYRMRVTAGPTNLGVGDPITVRVQIAGRGALDALQLPLQTDWRDFNTYPPTAKTQPTDDLGLDGTKSFEQVVTPQNQEIKALPALRFSFFNPDLRQYVTLHGPAIPLVIRPSGIAPSPPPSLGTNTGGANSPQADDIIHIQPRLELAAVAPLLFARPWFVTLQGVPLLLWLSVFVWRRRSEALANNPRLRRQREVAAKVRDGLKELRAHAEARRSDDFFAVLFRLLQEQLGERLDLPASAITEAVIDERLRARGLLDGSLSSLHELFQTCNIARYAPVQSSQELAALIPKLETALNDLRTLKP